VPYDPLRDFLPISLIASGAAARGSTSLAAGHFRKQLVALAKVKPGEIIYASNGIGSSTHLATELFVLMTEVRMTHVPYKGLSLAMTDLLSGQVPIMFSSAVAMLPHVRNGKLRAWRMTGAKRSPVIPEVPTVAEAASKATNQDRGMASLRRSTRPAPSSSACTRRSPRAVRLPDIQDRLIHEAVIPIGGTPEEFSAHIKIEFARMARVIRESGIKLD
jgi:tripartite-type tricarboxylate transporter receptor subunit TctC